MSNYPLRPRQRLRTRRIEFAGRIRACHGVSRAPLPHTAQPELFLSLLGYEQPRPRLRAGLFELWLRAEPKPKGGIIWLGSMDDEFPVLHWLLRGQAAEVFQDLIGTHHTALEEFVSWFLHKARPYAEYFTGTYKFSSFVVYTYGRPRFAAWAKLAKEVEDAATNLGIAIPAGVRLPAMPHLEEPTRSFSTTSPLLMSPRRVKRFAEQLFGQDPGGRSSDS
jgi:hypothetical protein